jgi:hypothetical protein
MDLLAVVAAARQAGVDVTAPEHANGKIAITV